MRHCCSVEAVRPRWRNNEDWSLVGKDNDDLVTDYYCSYYGCQVSLSSIKVSSINGANG